MKQIRVDQSGRYLVDGDGRAFFYLADTAWELFHRLTMAEAEVYLSTRARQGFTVIQAVVLAEFDGLNQPNANGDRPLTDNDPSQPNEAYFEHVDAVVRRANELGMMVGMLPTWGDKITQMWGKGPEVFDPGNARGYGRFLGNRYRDAGVIWVLGGDRPVQNRTHLLTWGAMAEGLAEGDGGTHLMTFHPAGRHGSSEYVHNEKWLDFNMIQSGHQGKNVANWRWVVEDYLLTPIKPTLDGEPNYEDHPVMSPKWGWEEGGEWFDDFDCRKSAYRGVFGGACGHTYGCHDVWQMFDPARNPAVNHARTPWREAIELAGAGQMGHMRRLWESRDALLRRPDQAMLVCPQNQSDGVKHMRAMSATDGSHAMVYTPVAQEIWVDLSRLRGEVRGSWFDPRTGEAVEIGGVKEGDMPLVTPGEWDWVLVLDSVKG